MGKIIEVRKLYKETLNRITKNEENWLSFLDSAAWAFKYDFTDKILIYAQRPDAKACAELKIWNNKCKRWVNKNSKGIFIMSKDENSKYPFKLVFDVSDTHNFQGTDYKLWEVKSEYENKIIETLEVRFGAESKEKSLSQSIIINSYNMVIDNIQDYIPLIDKYKKGTFLESIKESQISDAIIPIIWSSVSYMLMTRCGIDAKKEIDINEFNDIKDFKNHKLITILGNLISDISEMGLREIAKTVVDLQDEEKNKNRTFVKNQKEDYYNNVKNEIKGGNENENKIYETRRLSNTEFDYGRGENTDGQIRNNEIELSKNTKESRIHNIENGQPIDSTFERSRGTSNEYDTNNSRENAESRWSNRNIKDDRSDEVDTVDEQLQDGSRGTSGERDNLQLELLTEKEQKQIITEVENASVFSFTQEMIDEELKTGSNFEKGKFRIYEYLTKNLSSKENVDFLKKEYGEGGKSSNRFGVLERHNAKGILLTKGYVDNAQSLLLNWYDVEKRIRELISSDRYFNSKEKEEYKKWLEEKNVVINENKEEIKNVDRKEYVYDVADRVFIGTDEYEIVNKSLDKVTIVDIKFPLFTQEMNYDEFDRKAKENPYNTHLIKEINKKDKIEEKNVEIVENSKIEKQEEFIEDKPILSNIKRKDRNKIEYFDLHPEIPIEDRNNFKIQDDLLGIGTKKEKYKNNIAAIKVLKLCEKENRYATPEEQEILSKYIGWGGLQEVFDSRKDEWNIEYKELKSLLTEKEYKNAEASVLTAFFTPPIVIKTIYKALEGMGLQRGNILEPSCRSRKFYGLVTRYIKRLQNVWSGIR